MNNEIINLLNEITTKENLLNDSVEKIKNIIDKKIEELKNHDFYYRLHNNGFCYRTKPHSFFIDYKKNILIVNFYERENNDMRTGNDNSDPYYYRWNDITIPLPNDILFSDINLGTWADTQLLNLEIDYENKKINELNLEIQKKSNQIKELQKVIDNYKE
jgi:hypothetical protein